MPLHLKSKDRKRFAILVEPASIGIINDESLYAQVHKHGKAVLRAFSEDNTLELEPDPVTLTPAEFESLWQGD